MTQLTPEGLLYTVCWLLFFSAALEKLEGTVAAENNTDQTANAAENEETSEIAEECYAQNTELPEKESERRRSLLDVLSEYSMIIYLIHPLFLYYWLQWFELLGFSISQVPVAVFYLLVLVTSFIAGVVIHKLAKRFRPIGLLLLGRQPK